MGTAGRPTKYTKATVARLVEAVEKGSTYELAAYYAGIGERTLYDWLERYPQLVQDIKAAEARAAARWLDVIERSANEGNWTAAAWKLERRYPHMYGRTVQETKNTHEHSGPHGQPIQIQHFDASTALADATAGSGDDREDAL